VLGLLLWNLAQGRALQRMSARLGELRVELEETKSVANRSASEVDDQGRRVDAVEERIRRATGGPGPSEMVHLRRWISRVEERARINAVGLRDLSRRVDDRDGADRPAPTAVPSREPASSGNGTSS
jgi:hypothetical protein